MHVYVKWYLHVSQENVFSAILYGLVHSYTHKFNFLYLISNYSKIKLRKQTFLIKKNQKFTYLYQQYPAKANPAIPATLQPMTITTDENMQNYILLKPHLLCFLRWNLALWYLLQYSYGERVPISCSQELKRTWISMVCSYNNSPWLQKCHAT